MSTSAFADPADPPGSADGKLLCLTICGYRRPGMSEEDYRHHMTKVSAPLTQGLMVKYGVVRWTQGWNSFIYFRLSDAALTAARSTIRARRAR